MLCCKRGEEVVMEPDYHAYPKHPGFSMKAGWKASGICDQISNVYFQDVLSQLTTIVIAAALIVLPAIIAFYLMKKYIKWYKEEICDNMGSRSPSRTDRISRGRDIWTAPH